MRPVKLIMSAFGPYAGCVEIPFEKFGNKGLYLITAIREPVKQQYLMPFVLHFTANRAAVSGMREC